MLPVGEFAEDRREDVGEAFEATCAAERVAAAAVLERCLAEAIVSCSLLRVFQALIGFADCLELGFAFAAAVVTVRMMLLGELAIGSFDRLRVGRALHAKNRVIILIHHLHAPGTRG